MIHVLLFERPTSVKEHMSSSMKSWQWHLMSITVCLIGMLSIFLLMWADRISERLRIDADIVDAVMDVQIHAANAHLWLEQAIGGDTDVDVKKVIADLDQAINLVDVTLNGGKSEHDWIPVPLEDPELRLRAETIKSLLKDLKLIGLARLRDPGKSGLGSGIDQRFNLLYKEILDKTRVMEDIMEIHEAGNEEKSRRLILGILAIWAFIVIAATAGLWGRERERKCAKEKLLKANEQLLSQAEELTEHRGHLTRLVERRSYELTAANESLRIEIAERLQTCEMLEETEREKRDLSSRLIDAQEIERKRISMELHDELGQALNVTKLRLRLIEKGLREDQRTIREDCEELLEYMNHVIEDVRRLSLDLSPTVLEDLGLTSALRWLVDNLAKSSGAAIKSEIEKIDHLFPQNQWIAIYRVIQESLTNIGKHARFENASVVIRSHDDKVTFSVEDDGIGFDPEQASMKGVTDKGFGLTTMNERVRMMGGVFDLWSRDGEGTRITFTIPTEVGGA